MTKSWKSWGWKIVVGAAMGFALALAGNCTLAQITPDRTLPNNSIVTPSGTNGTQISCLLGQQGGRGLGGKVYGTSR